MTRRIEKSLPSPSKIKEILPLTEENREKVSSHRSMVHSLLTGKDNRFAIVLGPCSIHDPAAAIEYGVRLKNLEKRIENSFPCIMRAYVEKPRTINGWKGFVYDPYLDGSNNIRMGLFLTRQLFLTLIESDIAIATELLTPFLLPYIDDLIAWAFIGARTSASQLHRELASSLPVAVGFKNSIDGNVEQAIHAMKAAESSHHFFSINSDGSLATCSSSGNQHTHLVLRGSSSRSNYDSSSISNAISTMRKESCYKRILVDCSHGNCKRNFREQREPFQVTLAQFIECPSSILGVMLESHLDEGNQPFGAKACKLKYGVSITDPCIGWKETEQLILDGAEQLQRSTLTKLTQS